jgi:hypothetical protein
MFFDVNLALRTPFWKLLGAPVEKSVMSGSCQSTFLGELVYISVQQSRRLSTHALAISSLESFIAFSSKFVIVFPPLWPFLGI